VVYEPEKQPVKIPTISGKLLKLSTSNFMFVVYAIISIILIVFCCRKGNCGGKKVKEMVVKIKGKVHKEDDKKEEPPKN